MALLDMLGVLALVPLMELLTGGSATSGALGVISRVIGNDSRTALAVAISMGIVVAFALKAGLTIIFRWWQLGFLAREAALASARLLRAYLQAPYEFHLKRPVADLMRTLGDGVAQTYNGVVGGSLAAFAEVVTIVGLGGVLLVTNPIPAVVAAIYLAVVSLLISRAIGHRSTRAGEDLLTANLASFRSALHSLGGVKEIAVRHNSEVFVRRYETAQLELVDSRRRLTFLTEVPKYALELAFIIGVALLALVTFVVEGPGPAVASLAVFVGAGFRILPSVVRLIAATSQVRGGLPGYRLISSELPAAARVQPDERKHPASPLSGDVRVEQLGYSYPDGRVLVLKGLDFEVPVGTSLAIVGASGSGKSTLVNLMLGLLAPTQGRVLVGGVDIQDRLTDWQTSIGLVPQSVYVFDGNLRDNVTFGLRPDQVEDDKVLTAVRRARLGDLLSERGLDNDLGERGVGVSGGQLQRIGLARALYYEPSVIVLDEATSALDNITEHEVTQTIKELHGETTLIIVAHRLSTVRHCDQLIFLEDGVIAARGTFEEVRASNATFARLVQLGDLGD